MGIVRNQSIKNSISFYFGMAIGAINTVVIYPHVFQNNPEYLGLIHILVAYAIVISIFTTLGVPKTFVKYFPVVKEKGQLYFLSLITPLIGFFFALLSYFLFKQQIFDLLNASELLRDNFFYIILLVFFIGFYDILTSISRSFLSAVTPIIINEVFLKFYSMLVLLFYWFGYLDFGYFLKIYLLGYVLKFAILYFLQWKNNRLELTISIKDLKIKELMNFGIYVMAGGAAIMIVSRVDMMMIGALLDLEQVAFYTVAFFIGNSIKIPGKSIVTISIPLIAKAWENQDFDEIQNLYSKSSINQLIVGGVFFICVWLNIDEVFSLLPEKFQGGKWVVFFIGISQLFNITSGLNGAIIVNSKYYRYDLYTNILLVFLTILTNYILIPIYGIDGAALATAISVLMFNLIRMFVIKIKMNMHPFSINTIKTICLLLILFLFINMLPNSNYAFLDIVFKSSIVLAIYLPAVLYFNLSQDINAIFNDIVSKFKF